MPEEKLPRIFDRFYRCDEARTIKGSGVGLYIVKYIMERHGGTAEAENDDGLEIQLYFRKGAKMERILIAEDDEKIAWLEKDYLESNGYEARIVANGDKVIPELMQDSYDLLLLDIMLPGMSGYDICRKIREEIDIPILMVTARTESIDVIRGLGLERMIISPSLSTLRSW